MKKTGIVSYSAYVPRYRVKVAEIAAFWEKDGDQIAGSLGIAEKSVPGIDEDAVTMATEVGFQALQSASVNHDQIQALLVGSESHPYAVKPSSTIVGELLGIDHHYLALDTEFACKAATGAMQLVAGLVESKQIEMGMIIGSDTAQAKPGDALEYTAACAAAGYVLGREQVIAEIVDFTSYSSNTPDFWRRDGQRYPSHGGRFTGEPAYFHHVMSASTRLLEKTKMKPADFDYAVFHMPNNKFPKEVAKRLGFTPAQIARGLIVEKIGNPYSASALTGLAAVLDQAKPGQTIFVCSYGSGAGSDAFVFRTTPLLKEFQKKPRLTVEDYINRKEYEDYPSFIKTAKAKDYI